MLLFLCAAVAGPQDDALFAMALERGYLDDDRVQDVLIDTLITQEVKVPEPTRDELRGWYEARRADYSADFTDSTYEVREDMVEARRELMVDDYALSLLSPSTLVGVSRDVPREDLPFRTRALPDTELTVMINSAVLEVDPQPGQAPAQVVEETVFRHVMLTRALDLGLQYDPIVQAIAVDCMVSDQVVLTDEGLRAWFDEHPEQFQHAPRVWVSASSDGAVWTPLYHPTRQQVSIARGLEVGQPHALEDGGWLRLDALETPAEVQYEDVQKTVEVLAYKEAYAIERQKLLDSLTTG